MSSPNWRDLAGGAPADVPAPPSTGTPAPTPNWRDLASQPQPQPQPTQAAAGVPSVQSFTVPSVPAEPAPPATGAVPPGQLAWAQAVPPEQLAWAQAQQLGATPATPQPTAPATAPQGDPAEASAALGMQLAGAGAEAADVDTAAMLRAIQSLQAQVAALTQQQNAANAPEVVKYATAFADHLQAKADAHPVINADPDHTFIPGLRQAAELVNAAEHVASSGSGHEHLVSLAKDAGKWVETHARRFRSIDYDYLVQLAEEVAGAAAKLLA